MISTLKEQMTPENAATIFRHELRYYEAYFSLMTDLSEREQLINNQMENVKSPLFSIMPGSSSPVNTEAKLIEYMQRKDMIVYKRNLCFSFIKWIESIIDNIQSNTMKVCVIECYMKMELIVDVAEQLGMHEVDLSQRMAKGIKGAITADRISNYNYLQHELTTYLDKQELKHLESLKKRKIIPSKNDSSKIGTYFAEN